MSKLKFYLALWVAKLSVPALKITHHNGTDFPGQLAVKICPDFLRYVGKPRTIITVTGTNGKTTVGNMLSDILEASGHRVISNRSGSNIITGISTALLRGCNIFGRDNRYDIAVLEVDERSSVRVYPDLTPDYVVVTNLSRDSIMRNAHPGYIADIMTDSIPGSAKLVLNADDLISGGICPENPRAYYGIDRLDTDVTECINRVNDMQICPQCSHKLTYEYLRYHNVGKAVCPNCGFHSPDSDYLAQNVDLAGGTMSLVENGQRYDYPLITDSIFNVYNMVAVIAALRQLGMEHSEIQRCMEKTAIPATRHSIEEVGKVRLVMQMPKEHNSLAASRVFDYLSTQPGRKELFLMMNSAEDAAEWSENPCWLHDSDFEFINRDDVVQIVCTGARGEDFRLRMLLAGIPDEKIVCESDEFKAAERLAFTPGDDVYMLYGTDNMPMVEKMQVKLRQLAAQRAEEVQA